MMSLLTIKKNYIDKFQYVELIRYQYCGMIIHQ